MTACARFLEVLYSLARDAQADAVARQAELERQEINDDQPVKRYMLVDDVLDQEAFARSQTGCWDCLDGPRLPLKVLNHSLW